MANPYDAHDQRIVDRSFQRYGRDATYEYPPGAAPRDIRVIRRRDGVVLPDRQTGVYMLTNADQLCIRRSDVDDPSVGAIVRVDNGPVFTIEGYHPELTDEVEVVCIVRQVTA